jgi:ATP-dependent exoDNAse (exonuclease V) beta subunit
MNNSPLLETTTGILSPIENHTLVTLSPATLQNTIHIVTASAGTGKTYRLTTLLVDANIPPDHILATTFTVKAAHELLARARTRLLQANRPDDAQLLPTALIGTVNALGRRLLETFAYDLGLSPTQDVIPETDTALFLQEALSTVLTDSPWQDQVEDAAEAFNIDQATWQQSVRSILDAARHNRLTPAALEACGHTCAQELLACLDPPQDGDWDTTLRTTIETVLANLPKPYTKTEHEAKQVLSDAQDALRQHGLPWSWWPKLIHLNVGSTWHYRVTEVRTAAQAYLHHPRLRTHIEQYVQGLFHFAAQGLEAYRTYKADARLIDYGDQEAGLLQLLETAEPRIYLAEQVHLFLVDEFQDTSPLQLAIFLKLAALSKQSIWVGGPKQAIYNFRGTDPELMHACLRHLGQAEVLDTCWRSRPTGEPGIDHLQGAVRRPAYRSDAAEGGPGRVAGHAAALGTVGAPHPEQDAGLGSGGQRRPTPPRARIRHANRRRQHQEAPSATGRGRGRPLSPGGLLSRPGGRPQCRRPAGGRQAARAHGHTRGSAGKRRPAPHAGAIRYVGSRHHRFLRPAG